MTVRKTVVGVTSRRRDFAIVFSLPNISSVRMPAALRTVPGKSISIRHAYLYRRSIYAAIGIARRVGATPAASDIVFCIFPELLFRSGSADLIMIGRGIFQSPVIGTARTPRSGVLSVALGWVSSYRLHFLVDRTPSIDPVAAGGGWTMR
jgi:hypothetical protein